MSANLPATIDIDRGTLVDAVVAAGQAPSMHNTQPWRFRLLTAGLEIRGDRQRHLPVADPSGWGVRLACGAAAANAALALRVAGYEVATELCPRREDDELMARVTVTGRRPPNPQELAMHAAIPRRHSNRFPFTDQEVPSDVRAALVRLARDHGAWLELLTGRIPLMMVAEIVASAEARLRQQPAYLAELSAWSRRGIDAADGVPLAAAGPAPESHDLFAMRDFGGPARTAGRDYESDPLGAVLGTAGDTAYDQLVAGVALQHVLLYATDVGLCASLLSQPIEVPQAREQLQLGLRQRGVPQIVMRIGYGRPGVASARRPVDDLIDR